MRPFQNEEQKLDEGKKILSNYYSGINEQQISAIPRKDFECKNFPEVFDFLKIESDQNGIPKVSLCIPIDEEMHVALYCNKGPVPLHQWSLKWRACRNWVKK